MVTFKIFYFNFPHPRHHFQFSIPGERFKLDNIVSYVDCSHTRRLNNYLKRNSPFNYRWYTLAGKTEKSAEKNRGELEVKIAFIVQRCNDTQSLNDLSIRKKKHSIKNLAVSVGKLECFWSCSIGDI